MPTNFPGGIDYFGGAAANPIGVNYLVNPPHAQQHANANDAITAIETYLGTNPQGAFIDVRTRIENIESKLIGPAGGDLTGTYPNPTIGTGKVSSGKLATNSVSTSKIVGLAVTGAKLEYFGPAPHGGTATYGSDTLIPRITIDDKGRVSSVTEVAVSGGGGGGGTYTGVAPIDVNAGTNVISFLGWPANSSGVLQNDGSGGLSWVAAPAPSGAAGSPGQVQFNTGGAFDASSNLRWNGIKKQLIVDDEIITDFSTVRSGLKISDTTITMTSSGLINITNKSYVRIMASGTIYAGLASAAAQVGCISVLELADSDGSFTLINHTDVGVILSSDWNPNINDTLTVIWNGDYWVEVARSSNKPDTTSAGAPPGGFAILA